MTPSTAFRLFGVSLVGACIVAACGGDDSRPGTAPPGSGGTGGGTGTGSTGGTGGVTDAGTDSGDAANDAPFDAAAHCNNQTLDGDESDVDCGGSCLPCAQDKKCNAGSDCAEGVCDATAKTCKGATCVDQVKNGSETDKDCGGSNCDPCDDKLACAGPSDCKSGVCSSNICQEPSCGDGVKNGLETDTDCGGTCPGNCTLGQGCVGNFDCATDNCVAKQCQCAVGMVIAPATGGGAYCIDQYEVSYADYTKFWQANPTASLQIAECQWNTTYTPPQNWPAKLKQEAWPVRNVDWCDAYAYCKWAGKRLCGKIGGGRVAPGDYDKHTVSQWHNGCSAGANLYPYGQSYDLKVCIGADYSYTFTGIGTVNAGTYPMFPGNRKLNTQEPKTPPQDCQGASPGLFDMSGNTAEWEDSCDATIGSSDNCRLRGGSYLDGSAALRCDADRTATRDATPGDVGFRCCSP
ncbi:MAG TPA: SUMF1/EgtB/PvdO family nonheme iron enzyme [Polyangiaceae bacterium]|nr:SUMF1/EgtB/PvdO family nonheme iron enzyme [Polyangiaceae bacterium]